jgi:hypothetical protein
MALTPELRAHLGHYKWERYLNDRQLELLALHRMKLGEGEVNFFARELARVYESADFVEDLENAADLQDRAELHFCAELSAYPFRIELADEDDE